MTGSWRSPGRLAVALYSVLAMTVSGGIALVSRLQIERQRGRLRVADQLPDGPIIVVANHTSLADGFLLALVCRRMGRTLRLLATAGVFRIPMVGWLARTVGYIPVHRASSSASDSLAHAAEALRAGEAVGLFPEGRISRHPDNWPERGRTGAVRLALLTGAPVIPVAMVGAHRVVGRDRVLTKLMLGAMLRPRVRSRVGDPIDVAALLDDPDDAQAVRIATDAVMAIVIDMIEDVRQEVAPDPIGVERAPAS